MSIRSINPATGETLRTYEAHTEAQIDAALTAAETAARDWRRRPIEARAAMINRVGEVLRERRDECARVITAEMGKLFAEAQAEVEKCAWACEYYAEHGPKFLADEIIETDAGRSLVACQPLGTVLAVMPWNFPFWQVIRFAAPALLAGNTAVLKHASNVPGCALKIEQILRDSGLPENVFQSLLVGSDVVQSLIEDPRIHAVTLTGSDKAGRSVGGQAGGNLKKTVLELGGSDPFVVLEDADIQAAATTGVKARFQNAGQSCIAAKRFILVDSIADEFLQHFRAAAEKLVPGDPMQPETRLAPMARGNLRDELHEQVQDALDKGAEAVLGCRFASGGALDRGYFYEASILANVDESMRAWQEELFGPVAIVIRVRDEEEALQVANATPFGLGGAVWTRDLERGERFARELECGAAFVNGMVKSDPRLPFGGIKASGYGRELSWHGIREFVNQKTVWIG